MYNVQEYYAKKMKQDYYSNMVKEDPSTLKYVPEEFRSKKMCTRAIIHSDTPLIKFVPEDKLTEEMCSISIRKNISSFTYIPDHFKTYELCLELIKLNGDMISLIPDIHKTFDLCNIALETSTIPILCNIPSKKRFYLLCDKAVDKHWNELKYVPYRHRDYKLCLKAYNKAPNDRAKEEILKLIPEEMNKKEPFNTGFKKILLTKDILENCEEVYRKD